MLAASIEYICCSICAICAEVCSRVRSCSFFRLRAALAAVGIVLVHMAYTVDVPRMNVPGLLTRLVRGNVFPGDSILFCHLVF